MTAVRFTFALLISIATPAFGQPDTVVIRAGRLLDGVGGSRNHVDIVVVGDRIIAVQPASGPATYDLSDRTVLPGLIDTHVHVNWHFDPDGRTHHRSQEEESREEATLYAVENAYTTLLGGVTTVQSLGSTVDGPVRNAIDRGAVPGPTILTSLGQLSERSGAPEELRIRVRELHADGADVIKLFASASIRVGGTPTMTQEQLDAACGEATSLGLRTAVHAHGPESAQRAVRAGCTVIEHGALLDRETLTMMAEHGTFFDPNIHLIFRNYFENRERYIGVGGYTEEGFQQMEVAVPRALEVFRWAIETPQLQVVFGTDAVAGAHGRNVEELIYRVEEGRQDPMAAIVSATSVSARSLGLHEETGTIAPGLAADIIAVAGDPLTDIGALRTVVFVMKSGVAYRNQ